MSGGNSTSRRAVVATLRGTQQASIAELAATIGLPRSTVAHTVTTLLRAGLVREHASRSGARGRPSRTFSLLAPPGPIAVVVAAAHGTVCGIVATDGRVLSELTGPHLDGDADGRRGRPALDLIDHALKAAGVASSELSLGVVGLPGPSRFRPTVPVGGQAVPLPVHHLRRLQVWDGLPAADVLARHLDCPVYSENDANLAAVGEVASGAGYGLDTVMFVNLAFGTSASLVLNGRVHRGRSGLAGEIGHLHAVDHGQLCECGGRGCFWLGTSIPALLEELAAAHRQGFTVAEMIDAVQKDQPAVVRALAGFGHSLGRRLADAVVLIDPDVIVLDGALGSAAAPIIDGVRAAVNQYAPPAMARDVPIMPGALGYSAALAGAAALVRTEGLHEIAV